jgi:hypothetical protein
MRKKLFFLKPCSSHKLQKHLVIFGFLQEISSEQALVGHRVGMSALQKKTFFFSNTFRRCVLEKKNNI